MIGAGKPQHDVDALARRLPRREPTPDRAAVMRNAILEAAASTPEAPVRGSARGWVIGCVAAAAAAACVWFVLRADRQPAQGIAIAPPPAGRSTPAAPPGAPPAPPEPPLPPAMAAAPAAPAHPAGAGDPALAAAAPAPLPEGVTMFVAAQALQVARGNATITAPPDARFEVEVRGDEIKHVTVTAGWVVVASGRGKTTVVPARHTWTSEDPEPRPVPSNTPSTAPAPASPAALPRTAASGVTSAPPTDAATITRNSPLADAGERRPPALALPGASAATASRSGSDEPPAPPPPAPPAPPSPRMTGEQDFRDGLRALLAGDVLGAIAPLSRACDAPSASQDDSCYWAAVAALRSGAHPRARRAFADLLARWPGSTHAGEASVALGWLLLEVGDRAGARARFAAAADDRMPSVRADALRGLATAQ